MTTVLFATLVAKAIDFLRLLTNLSAQKSAVLTQLAAWTAGIGLVVLGSHASVAQGLVLPGVTVALGKLDGSSQVLVGMLVSSAASVAVDFRQALDRSDSAVKPPLIGP